MRYLLFIVLLSSCNYEKVEIVSPSKTQFLQVIDKGDYRYVYDLSESNNTTSKGHIKLDISEVLQIEDALFICWENEESKVEILCPKAKIIENSFLSKRYTILTKHAETNQGIPDINKYHSSKCFELGMQSKNIFPSENAHIK